MEYHGIDGEGGAPHPGIMPNGGTFYSGDSREIFESIPNGFHVLFIDACHCNNCVMLDFLNYGPKVVSGGWVLFHDTNPSPRWVGVHHGKYAGHGPKTPAFHIAVREALRKLGLLDNSRTDWSFTGEQMEGDGLGMMRFLKLR
jgi:hypothetical protein